MSDAGPDSAPPPAAKGASAKALGSMLVALLPGALIVVLTFVLFQQAADRELSSIGAVCEGEAGRVQTELVRELEQRTAAMERLAAARAADGEAWRLEAEALLQRDMEFRAVIEFDSAFAPVLTIPPEARMMSALDARDDDTRAMALRVASGTLGREAVAVSTAPLASGDRQVLACAPVVRSGRRTGWIVGVVRLRDLLDAGLARTLRAGFSAAVFEGQAPLFGARLEDGGPGVRFAREAEVLHGPLLWRVEIWPAEERARQLQSWGPASLFIAGMLLAYFVSVTVYLWRERRMPRDTPGA